MSNKLKKIFKNKIVEVEGLEYNDVTNSINEATYNCIITNDEKGKTLSIHKDGEHTQIILPFEQLEKYLI